MISSLTQMLEKLSFFGNHKLLNIHLRHHIILEIEDEPTATFQYWHTGTRDQIRPTP